jgi:hypothetical protein
MSQVAPDLAWYGASCAPIRCLFSVRALAPEVKMPSAREFFRTPVRKKSPLPCVAGSGVGSEFEGLIEVHGRFAAGF